MKGVQHMDIEELEKRRFECRKAIFCSMLKHGSVLIENTGRHDARLREFIKRWSDFLVFGNKDDLDNEKAVKQVYQTGRWDHL